MHSTSSTYLCGSSAGLISMHCTVPSLVGADGSRHDTATQQRSVCTVAAGRVETSAALRQAALRKAASSRHHASGFKLPQALASLGQSAARTALAGRAGLVSTWARTRSATASGCRLRRSLAGGGSRSPCPVCMRRARVASLGKIHQRLCTASGRPGRGAQGRHLFRSLLDGVEYCIHQIDLLDGVLRLLPGEERLEQPCVRLGVFLAHSPLHHHHPGMPLLRHAPGLES